VNGCQSTIIRNKYIAISDTQRVAFSQSTTNACRAPLTVNFTDATTPADSNYTYLWIFGDGKTATTKNASNTYSQGGNFTVSLRVTSANGCQKTYTKPGLVSIFNPKAN